MRITTATRESEERGQRSSESLAERRSGLGLGSRRVRVNAKNVRKGARIGDVVVSEATVYRYSTVPTQCGAIQERSHRVVPAKQFVRGVSGHVRIKPKMPEVFKSNRKSVESTCGVEDLLG